jgi:hypothetical protein
MAITSSPAAEPTVTAFYARVSVPAKVYLTVPIPQDASKRDIRDAVVNGLRTITDAEDAINVLGDTVYNPVIYFDKKAERTIDDSTIFTLRGLEVIDVFDGPAPQEPFKQV